MSIRWSASLFVGLVLVAACDRGAPSERSTIRVDAPDAPSLSGDGFILAHGVARAASPIGLGVAVAAGGLELTVADRDERGATTTMTVRMATVRIDGTSVVPGSLVVNGSRATLARAGFDEWFVNRSRGIEHGYTVHAPPDDDPEIRIDVAFEGLEAVVRSPKLVTLADGRGRDRLSYRGPHAEDARGRSLPINFEEAPDGIELVVDAEGALYPVTIDPTFELASTLFATTPSAMDLYGRAVAIDGVRAAVGAPFDGTSGVVYTYELIDGVWMLDERLDLMAGNSAQFGRTVALDGDTLAVGAPSLTGGGLVRVYRRNMTGWAMEADLQPSTASGTAPLALDIRADTLLIGDSDDDTLGTNAGTAFVYERDGANQWILVAELQATDGASGDGFGRSVALAGDDAIIGAPGVDFTTTSEGKLYVFHRDMGSWQAGPTQMLDAGVLQRDAAALGQEIAAEGTRVVARNKAASNGSSPNEVLVFERSGGIWSLVDAIEPPVLGPEDVGAALDVVGDRVVAGSPTEGPLNEGRVRIFELVLGAWQQVQVLDNPTPFINDFFGQSVALNHTGTLFVGDGEDTQLGSSAGAVYVFPLVGDPCTDGTTCATGICDEMVCCNVPCGPCGVCDVSGMEGQCQALADGTEVPECTPVLCDGASFDCPECIGDDDCVTDHFCDGGACSPTKGNGETCAASNECQSMQCVDGVCCDSGCDAQCQACDEPGSVGTCTTIMGQPHGDRPPCPADFCEADIAYSDASCRGGLTCEADSTACSPYGCDETTCHDTCLSTQQCAEGFSCLVDSGTCVSTDAQCEGSTLTFPDATTQSCEPYRCTDGGVCLSQCTSGEHCSAGRVCDAMGACVTAPPAVEAVSCAMGTGGRERPQWGWLLMLGALAMQRRRSSGRRLSRPRTPSRRR